MSMNSAQDFILIFSLNLLPSSSHFLGHFVHVLHVFYYTNFLKNIAFENTLIMLEEMKHNDIKSGNHKS